MQLGGDCERVDVGLQRLDGGGKRAAHVLNDPVAGIDHLVAFIVVDQEVMHRLGQHLDIADDAPAAGADQLLIGLAEILYMRA